LKIFFTKFKADEATFAYKAKLLIQPLSLERKLHINLKCYCNLL